ATAWRARPTTPSGGSPPPCSTGPATGATTSPSAWPSRCGRGGDSVMASVMVRSWWHPRSGDRGQRGWEVAATRHPPVGRASVSRMPRHAATTSRQDQQEGDGGQVEPDVGPDGGTYAPSSVREEA